MFIQILQGDPDSTEEALRSAVKVDGVAVHPLLCAYRKVQGLEGKGRASVEPLQELQQLRCPSELAYRVGEIDGISNPQASGMPRLSAVTPGLQVKMRRQVLADLLGPTCKARVWKIQHCISGLVQASSDGLYPVR